MNSGLPNECARQRWRRAFGCLITAGSCSWLALILLVDLTMQPNNFVRLFFALLFFQLSMLGFWIGFGRGSYRFFVAFFLTAAIGWGATLTDRISNFAIHQCLCFSAVLVASTTTGWLRYRKGVLRLSDLPTDRSEPFRFWNSDSDHLDGRNRVVACRYTNGDRPAWQRTLWWHRSECDGHCHRILVRQYASNDHQRLDVS